MSQVCMREWWLADLRREVRASEYTAFDLKKDKNILACQSPDFNLILFADLKDQIESTNRHQTLAAYLYSKKKLSLVPKSIYFNSTSPSSAKISPRASSASCDTPPHHTLPFERLPPLDRTHHSSLSAPRVTQSKSARPRRSFIKFSNPSGRVPLASHDPFDRTTKKSSNCLPKATLTTETV